MAVRIRITRDGSGNVNFETVTVLDTDNVFFLNLDPQAAHHPSLVSNQLGPAPSPPSSQGVPSSPYSCLIPGHASEQGIINIVTEPPEVND